MIDHITSLAWHLRSYSREDLWAMSFEERQAALRFIEDRIKTVEKTGLPIL